MLSGYRHYSEGTAALATDGRAGDQRSDPRRTYHKRAALAGERRQEQPALYNKGMTAGQKKKYAAKREVRPFGGIRDMTE